MVCNLQKPPSAWVDCTIAGYRFYSGNGGLATQVSLNAPEGVFVSNKGEIFVADTLNDVIRKVDTNGVITTVAGVYNMNDDNSPDGTLATSTKLVQPRAVAVTNSGTIYIADTGNHCIRRVDAESGAITTVVGECGVSGHTGDSQPAIQTHLNEPSGVAVWLDTETGDETIFIADTMNHRVRKVQKDGTVITIAGADGQLCQPRGIFADTQGNLYIADECNNVIRKWMKVNGQVQTAVTELNLPRGVAVIRQGGVSQIVVSDTMKNRVCTSDVDGRCRNGWIFWSQWICTYPRHQHSRISSIDRKWRPTNCRSRE